MACILPCVIFTAAVLFLIVYHSTCLLTQDSVHKAELECYKILLNSVGWFFFDLFILGYVEDPATGQSFRFPAGMKWTVYIEVSFKFVLFTVDVNLL